LDRFSVGTGRCGSTLLSRVLAECPRAFGAVLFAACLVAAGALEAHAQAPAAPDAMDAPLAAPTDVGRHAEEVAARLREMTRSLEDDAEFAGIEAEVSAHGRRVGELWGVMGRVLARNSSGLVFDTLANAWQALRADLERERALVDARAHRREADLATLDRMHASWTRSRGLAGQADVPAAVVERVEATLAAIEATRAPVERSRARVLVAQDSVSRSLQACDDAVARIAEARSAELHTLFAADAPPLWRNAPARQAALAAAPQAAADLAILARGLRVWADEHRPALVLSAALVVALVLALRRAKEAAAQGVAGPDFVASALETPVATGILLGVVLGQRLRPHPPLALELAVLVITMIAALSVLRPRAPARLLAVAWGLAALVLVDVVSQVLAMVSAFEQVIAFAVQAGAALLLLWGAAQARRETATASSSPRWRMLLRLLALACGSAAAAAALGYVDLVAYLGGGALFLIYTGLIALALRSALQSLVVLALSRGPLARLRSIARHRAAVRRWALRAGDLLILGTWLWLALRRFGLRDLVRDAFASALASRLRVGSLDLPVEGALGFAAVVVGVWLLTRMLVTLLEEDVYSRMALPRGVPFALSSLTRYGLLLAGFLLALASLGLDLTHLTVLVSAFGVGLGFGLQQIVKDFVSGLILLFERPIQIGDTVQLTDLVGEVERIGARASRLRTSEGAEVIVANSQLIDARLTNWTLSDRTRRVDVEVAVARPAASERVLAAMLEVARADPRVRSDPAPEALAIRFGGSSAEFQLRVWTDEPHWLRLRSDLAVAIERTLARAD
jgi:small-conductance mechanosensitive channel